jgi:hypothetical protein
LKGVSGASARIKRAGADAVTAPRFSAPGDVIDVSRRIPVSVTCEMEATDHAVARSPLSDTFASIPSSERPTHRQVLSAPASGGLSLRVQDADTDRTLMLGG